MISDRLEPERICPTQAEPEPNGGNSVEIVPSDEVVDYVSVLVYE
jgi:hypothetical protein